MAKEKWSQQDEITTLSGDDEFLVIQDSSGENKRIKAFNGTIYKKYIASLTQSGSNAPVAVINENTLSAAPVWTRAGVGTYILTLAGAFPSGKVRVFMGNEVGSGGIFFNFITLINSNSIGLITRDPATSFTPGDDFLEKTSIKIFIYP